MSLAEKLEPRVQHYHTITNGGYSGVTGSSPDQNDFLWSLHNKFYPSLIAAALRDCPNVILSPITVEEKIDLLRNREFSPIMLTPDQDAANILASTLNLFSERSPLIGLTIGYALIALTTKIKKNN